MHRHRLMDAFSENTSSLFVHRVEAVLLIEVSHSTSHYTQSVPLSAHELLTLLRVSFKSEIRCVAAEEEMPLESVRVRQR